MAAPTHRSLCPDGEHYLKWDLVAGETICARCGLPASTLVERFAHTLYGHDR